MDSAAAGALELFSRYMKVVGVPSLSESETGAAPLRDKTVGVINGSSWISLWSTYFGTQFLPGAKLVNVGNDAIQLSFMAAHARGDREVPPIRNRELLAEYARTLLELVPVDAFIVTCSTMNRGILWVRDAVRTAGIPVVQIDEPMMEAAVCLSGPLVVIATHGPTVRSTGLLLRETAGRMGKAVPEIRTVTTERCFELLGEGNIEGHNALIADAIREVMGVSALAGGAPVGATPSSVQPAGIVLAQLSMAVFLLEHPDPEAEFGVPVLTSAEYGFQRVRELLEAQSGM